MSAPVQTMLAFKIGDQQTQTIIVDASISENHVKTAEITKHPVEKGSSITDNIRPLPDTVTLECMVTNYPIGLPPSQEPSITQTKQEGDHGAIYGFSAPFDRVGDVLGLLNDAFDNSAIWTITTSLKIYDVCGCNSVSIPRSAPLGQVLKFTASFEVIRIVESEEVAVLPGKPKNKGAKTGKPVDTKTEEGKKQQESFAHALLINITGGGS